MDNVKKQILGFPKWTLLNAVVDFISDSDMDSLPRMGNCLAVRDMHMQLSAMLGGIDQMIRAEFANE